MGEIVNFNTHFRPEFRPEPPRSNAAAKEFLAGEMRTQIQSLRDRIVFAPRKFTQRVLEAFHRKTFTVLPSDPQPLDPEVAEEDMTLFEVARKIHEGQFKEAVADFQCSVPERRKEEVFGHLKNLGSHPPHLDTSLETQQALFATALHSKNYLTVRDISRWFSDLDLILARDNQDPKLVLLRP